MSWSTLIQFLLYFFITLFLLIVLIIILPIKVNLLSRVDGFYYEGKFDVEVLLGFLRGTLLINPKSSLFRMEIATIPVYRRQELTNGSRGEKLEGAGLGATSLIGPSINLLNSLKSHIHISKLDLDLVTGLSDPYTAGLLFGSLFPLIKISDMFISNASVSFTPVFTEDMFKGTLDGSFRLSIIMIIAPLFRFFFGEEFREFREKES